MAIKLNISNGEVSIKRPELNIKTTCLGIECQHAMTKSHQDKIQIHCNTNNLSVFDLIYTTQRCPIDKWWIGGDVNAPYFEVIRGIALNEDTEKRRLGHISSKSSGPFAQTDQDRHTRIDDHEEYLESAA